MVSKIIECVPNVSEGRDPVILSQLVNAVSFIPGVLLADYSADCDHNRMVFTLIGPTDGVAEAAFTLAAKACALIDLNHHKGVHPRMGAVDVIPFIPLKETTMQECITIAKCVAERISRALFVPVFLYEEAASSEERRNLADVRKKWTEWKPDYGPALPHPTAGVICVGARKPLIAFNVNLATSDVRIANEIAKKIRGSNGGLPFCKALGVRLASRGIVQVTMNMTDYQQTPLFRAFDMIRIEAEKHGVTVIGSELVGMAPAQALADCGARYLMLDEYDYKKKVLENFTDGTF